jgi:hypothetical protein
MRSRPGRTANWAQDAVILTRMAARFTCISWATQSYKHLFDGLRSDCRRWGYPCHLYEVDAEYSSLVKAWCNHPKIIRRGIEQFGTVLFMDLECRIVAPIPDRWSAPLVSVRKPRQKFWIRYNTGTVMADRSCLPWVDAWIRLIDDWEMGNLESGDYIEWPGDICDELALAAALAALGVGVNTAELEYIDRKTRAEIVRGLWKNEHTIVQHPTIHHWIKEHDPIECKKLFVQNYPGEPAEGDEIFARARGLVQRNHWFFDTDRRVYAPADYWGADARPWIDEPVTLSSAQR